MLHALQPLLLGVVLAAYWGRVLRMARKARRTIGRSANLVPSEPLGRALRLVWAPAVLVWVVHPFLTALMSHPPRVLRPLYASAPVGWCALVVATACFALTLACWRTMGRAWRMGIDPGERTALVAHGPFSIVQHPIYALSQLMMLASLAMIPSPLMLATGAVHIALLQWEARREERHMFRTHGDAYARYAETVGRFVPSRLWSWGKPMSESTMQSEVRSATLD